MNRPNGEEAAPEKRARMDRAVDRVVPRRLLPYREQLLYLVVGAWNTLFGYGVFSLLYYLLHETLHVDVILVLSYAVAVPNNYVCYRYIVFRSRGAVRRELPRFTVVYVVTLAANLVVLPLALRHLPLNAYAIQALYTVVVVVLSYLANKFFSFRGGQPTHGPGGPT